MSFRSFKNPVVWQKAHQWVLEIYHPTNFFPGRERFGPMSHSPQAAISIPANIADGFEKKRNLDKARFYNIAHGLIEECRYYLISAGGSRLWRYKTLKRNLGEVSRLLEAYARRVTRP